LITFFLFIIGFVFLFVGADILVKGASAIAHKLGVSDLIIGLTLVAFGTSAPELIVKIFASIQGSTEIAVGNVLGSNLINIAVILGLSTLIFPLKVSSTTVVKDIPICIGSVLLFIILAYDTIFIHLPAIYLIE